MNMYTRMQTMKPIHPPNTKTKIPTEPNNLRNIKLQKMQYVHNQHANGQNMDR
jgi:hypothetical protein